MDAVSPFLLDPQPSVVQVIAHRGFGESYPENTICAAREAVRFADAVEIDVRRCGSGELVASHWDDVECVTDREGDVADLPASELAGLRVEGSDCGVPLLTDVLDAIPPSVGVQLDLKERGVVDDAVALLHEVENDAAVSSFDPDSLWRTRMADESIPLAFNFGVRPDANFLTTEVLGCEYANLHWSLCLTTDLVERAHDAGMAVHAWPVGSRTLARVLKRRGVDGLIGTKPLGSARRGSSRVESSRTVAGDGVVSI